MPYFYKKYSGLTVSTSIDKFVYVTIKSHPHFKEKFRLNYSDTEIVNDVNKIKKIYELEKLLNILKLMNQFILTLFQIYLIIQA